MKNNHYSVEQKVMTHWLMKCQNEARKKDWLSKSMKCTGKNKMVNIVFSRINTNLVSYFLLAVVSSVLQNRLYLSPNIFVEKCMMLRRLKNMGKPPYYLNRELFYFSYFCEITSFRYNWLLYGWRQTALLLWNHRTDFDSL